jgi:uncharacterized protein (TIGR03000 family)
MRILSCLKPSFWLALVIALAIGDTCLAAGWGGGGGGRAGGWFGSQFNSLGVNYGYYGGPYRGGYGTGGGGLGLGYGGDTYYPPSSGQGAPANDQRAYPPPQPATPQPATATIELYVPENAEVWFQGRKTNLTGTLRRFITELLPPGVDYAYELRVRWTDANGQVQDQTRQVIAQAGRQLILNLQEATKK